MKYWLYLVVAILAEVIATSAPWASDGFSRLWLSLLVVAGKSSPHGQRIGSHQKTRQKLG